MPLLTSKQREALSTRIEPPDVSPDGAHLKRIWQTRIRNCGADTDLGQLQMGVSEILRVHERYDWGLKAVFSHDAAPALKKLACPPLSLNGDNDALAEIDKKAARAARLEDQDSSRRGRPAPVAGS